MSKITLTKKNINTDWVEQLVPNKGLIAIKFSSTFDEMIIPDKLLNKEGLTRLSVGCTKSKKNKVITIRFESDKKLKKFTTYSAGSVMYRLVGLSAESVKLYNAILDEEIADAKVFDLYYCNITNDIFKHAKKIHMEDCTTPDSITTDAESIELYREDTNNVDLYGKNLTLARGCFTLWDAPRVKEAKCKIRCGCLIEKSTDLQLNNEIDMKDFPRLRTIKVHDKLPVISGYIRELMVYTKVELEDLYNVNTGGITFESYDCVPDKFELLTHKLKVVIKIPIQRAYLTGGYVNMCSQVKNTMHIRIKEIVKYDFEDLVISHSIGFCKETFTSEDIREIVGNDLPICRIKNKKGVSSSSKN